MMSSVADTIESLFGCQTILIYEFVCVQRCNFLIHTKTLPTMHYCHRILPNLKILRSMGLGSHVYRRR
ncbi:hypothetical protein MXB_1745, partial [Myxobolus squamalis]